MKLKILNIIFESVDDFMEDLRSSLVDGKDPSMRNKSISFDSYETFKRYLTPNKIHILMAISRLKPHSMYSLEKILGRKYPHVHRDCKQLEDSGFIRLVESSGLKKQLKPELVFEYDLIKVNSRIEQVYSISQRSNDILMKAV